MKKLELLVCLSVLMLAAAPVFAQTPATASRSVLKQADHVQWADHYGPAGPGCGCGAPAGCGLGARLGCGCSGSGHIGCASPHYGYDSCCPPRPLLCALKRVKRMLDCLLPCHSCCQTGCQTGGGCLFGGRQPHLFHRGLCNGSMGCSTPCPSCSTPAASMPISDPFIDDPLPPKPLPDPAKDVRGRPATSAPYALRNPSPYKVTTGQQDVRRRAVEAASQRPNMPQASVNDKYATRTVKEMPAQRSLPAIREISPATAELDDTQIEAAPAPPALLPVTIRRTSMEIDATDHEIPVNPLRQ